MVNTFQCVVQPARLPLLSTATCFINHRQQKEEGRERSRSGNVNEKIILFPFPQHLHAFYSGSMHQCLRERQWAAHFHLLSHSRSLSPFFSLSPSLSLSFSLCGPKLLYSIICYLLVSFFLFSSIHHCIEMFSSFPSSY